MWRLRTWRIRGAGYAFLVILLFVLLAAWNTGTNLLYILTGGVSSFLILSLAYCHLSMQRLRMHREAPRAVHRKAPFSVRCRVENPKWLLPAFSVRVERAGAPGKALGYVPALPARRAASLSVRMQLDQRGVHVIPPFEAVTRFPFGLSERRKRFTDRLELVVYPRVRPVRTAALEQLQSGHDYVRAAGGGGDEFYSLREYAPGDDLRMIAWRASARLGFWVVREMARDRSRQAVFVLDTRDPGDVTEFSERFEEAVELVAGLAVTLLHQHYQVAIITPRAHLEPGEGTAHERQILELLARVNPEPDPPSLEAAMRSVEAQRAMVLHVSPDPRRWGGRRERGAGRILDPREVVNA